MTWQKHEFIAPKAYSPAAGVIKLGMIKMGQAPARAQLYFGIDVAKELGLNDGDLVRPFIGEDEHDGKLRIVKGEDAAIKINRKAFRGKVISLTANLGPVPKWGAAKRETEIVEYECDDEGGIIITLPKWYQAYRKHAQPKEKVLPAQRHAQDVKARLMGRGK